MGLTSMAPKLADLQVTKNQCLVSIAQTDRRLSNSIPNLKTGVLRRSLDEKIDFHLGST